MTRRTTSVEFDNDRGCDLARAAGIASELTAERGGRIVAVLAEWSRRHGEGYNLTLTGPAGGEFRAGEGAAPTSTMTATSGRWALAQRLTDDVLNGRDLDVALTGR